ncbi:NUDIX domain-containing protein [Thalassomonas sp. M1454]|uniref:NUDIX domain-containing protein n=1 Tax=Thalassomonas sp. M1454 TaxID=2594477 RepID=UPI00117F6D31|nr:NUDIX domain-containing protein [Thalassomonas sp. M1454]TRX53884.1 NUDIX domain-containing protein [Thalassomonas sp. M1454]
MTKSHNIQQFTANDVLVKSRDIKYQGFFRIDQYQIQHKLFNGGSSNTFSREIFERGDAVVLIPYDPITDKVVLIEQFRAGALRSSESPWMLEFIAGMFGDNESPVDVAIREAEEEANLFIDKDKVHHVMNFLSTPGGCSEKLYMYLAIIDASELSSGEVAGLECENEDILSHVVSRKQALTWLEQSKIENASTIIGLQWLAMNYKKIAKGQIN